MKLIKEYLKSPITSRLTSMTVFDFFDGTHTSNVVICIHCNGGANSSGIKYTGIFDKYDGFGKTRLYFFTSIGDIEIISNAFTCKIDIKNASHQAIPFLLCWLRILNSQIHIDTPIHIHVD